MNGAISIVPTAKFLRKMERGKGKEPEAGGAFKARENFEEEVA